MEIKKQTNLRGMLMVPGDKSISHRAVMFGSLAKGTTSIFLTRLLYGDLATLCKSTHSQLFTFQPLLFSFGRFRALC